MQDSWQVLEHHVAKFLLSEGLRDVVGHPPRQAFLLVFRHREGRHRDNGYVCPLRLAFICSNRLCGGKSIDVGHLGERVLGRSYHDM